MPKPKLGHHDGCLRALAWISSSVWIPNDDAKDNAESRVIPMVKESLNPLCVIWENSSRFVPAACSLGRANAASSSFVEIPASSPSANSLTQWSVVQGTFLNLTVAPLNEAIKLPVGSDDMLNLIPEFSVLIHPLEPISLKLWRAFMTALGTI